MASLYLGTGPLEQELVDCMQEALERSQEGDNPDLQVSILLDYTRGSRGRSVCEGECHITLTKLSVCNPSLCRSRSD